MSKNYRQLKLANGEEMIADVLQWANDDDASIVIRSALRIAMTVCCEDMNHLLTVNADQVVGETNPSKLLLKQYIVTVTEYQKSYEEENDTEEDISDLDVAELSAMFDSDNSNTVISLFPKNKMH